MDRVPAAQRLVWAQVMRPVVPLLYLDLNHFIYMARATSGRGRGLADYRQLLDEVTAAAGEGRVRIPLSGEHVWEMSRIRDPKQRSDIAEVMERLSGFRYLMGRPDLARLEFEAGFRHVHREPADPLPLPLIGTSFGWAFGMVGGLKVVDEAGRESAGEVRRAIGADAFERTMRTANHAMERSMLEGPSDADAEVLRAEGGYAPERAYESQKSRLDFELALSRKLSEDGRWRRGRLRDVVTAREITHEWLDAFNEILEERARSSRPGLAAGEETFKQIVAGMPHSQVAISMKTRYHRDPTHRWTTNDIVDIDALSVAYAYCDAVFTDKAARSALANSPELRGMRTFLPRSAQDLTEWLGSRPLPVNRDLLVPAH